MRSTYAEANDTAPPLPTFCGENDDMEYSKIQLESLGPPKELGLSFSCGSSSFPPPQAERHRREISCYFRPPQCGEDRGDQDAFPRTGCFDRSRSTVELHPEQELMCHRRSFQEAPMYNDLWTCPQRLSVFVLDPQGLRHRHFQRGVPPWGCLVSGVRLGTCQRQGLQLPKLAYAASCTVGLSQILCAGCTQSSEADELQSMLGLGPYSGWTGFGMVTAS